MILRETGIVNKPFSIKMCQNRKRFFQKNKNLIINSETHHFNKRGASN